MAENKQKVSNNFVAAYMVFMIGSIIAAILFACINMTPKEE